MYEEPKSGINLDAARDVWRRRKWLAIVLFLTTFSAIAPAVMVLPDVYRSSATVLIERQQIPDELVKSTVTSALETRLNTISQEIFSRSRLEGLIDRFGLYGELRNKVPLEVVMDRMRKDIRVELKSGAENRQNAATVAFAVSFTGSDPQKVAAVTNTLASFYIEENLKVREEQAAGTSQFLSAQLQQMKNDLEAQEKRVSDYKTRYLGQLPHQQEGNLSALERLNESLRLNADKQIRTNERLNALETLAAELEGSRRGPDTTAGRIAELREELRKLRKQYSDQYPDVIRVKAEIATLVEQLHLESGAENAGQEDGQDLRAVQLKNAITDAHAELRALKAEESRLRGSAASYQSKVENAPLREQEFQVLMRDYETTKGLYNSLLQRQKEAELAENMETRQKGEQFRVIDPAFPSEQPTAPNRQRLILVGLMLSLGLAGGVVLLAEQANTSFHSVEALRGSFAVPVLVTIPQIVTVTDRRRRAWRFGLATVSVLVALVAIIGGSYFVANGNERFVGFLLK